MLYSVKYAIIHYGLIKAQTEYVTPKEKTIEHIKEIIDGGMDAVMPGCDLWPAIIEDNMKAAVDTTHDYGTKPSPAVGRLQPAL